MDRGRAREREKWKNREAGWVGFLVKEYLCDEMK